MIKNILDNVIKMLRGKNGNVFLIIGAIILIFFILKIIGPLLWLVIVGGLIYFVFKFLETKKL